MTLVLKILMLCLLQQTCFGQTIRPEVQLLVDSIAAYDQLDGIYIGFPGIQSKQYNRFLTLAQIASSKELEELAASQHPVVKCAAFQSLCSKDSMDIIPLLIRNLYDTSFVSIQRGCIGSKQMTGDYFLETFYYYLSTKGSTYYSKHHRNIIQIDSILFYDPHIRLAYKEAMIKATDGDTMHYDRIRDIALNERIPVSVLALAKYKRQQDTAIIKSYFTDDKTHYHAIWAVREFPDTIFYPLLLKVFETDWKHKRYSYPKWRILYQALAKYPNAKTLELFDKTIYARNRFRRETLGRYLSIAIAKYPHPLFEQYRDKVDIDDLHKTFLGEEANVEN